MPETGGPSVVPKKGLTLDDLIAAIDRHERNPSNIPKVDTFHFYGERVSEWLERVEQALVGRSDIVKFQRILQYVLHSYHQEVKNVIEAAQGSWERFKEGMQRKYRLGDGLLTTADLEAMNKEDFTTIGAFVQEFKKRARKVHGILEEAQCAIFLGLLTASEAVELTRHGGGSTKLTWATIDRGVEVGCLDQVEQRQVRLQMQKRKERDATASGTQGVTRIVTDVLAQLGYATKSVVQRRVVTAVKVKGKEPVIEEAVQEELWEEEEPVPQHLKKSSAKNTGPRSIRNRPHPGSFTIEESEGECRRLWAEPEAGERVEAFSLSLSDIGKAMDLVAVHEMADPDAILALREQVLECPEAGRLKLVYRLPGSGGNPASAQTPSAGQRRALELRKEKKTNRDRNARRERARVEMA
ncbi:hypothetical protein CBR_g17745 [Chara braunii]|uniref:Retrotransposon gag domain-containing protein n=1 Tax=Chara braunii TaxID=69332 RepID=A0A388KVE2_CHABU|nr:hypothetical protein CBR_g17745 [Chara braunii]|eukprot:GBG74035.1 hypothetical protein CBR_g17745 [Chara braunii]